MARKWITLIKRLTWIMNKVSIYTDKPLPPFWPELCGNKPLSFSLFRELNINRPLFIIRIRYGWFILYSFIALIPISTSISCGENCVFSFCSSQYYSVMNWYLIEEIIWMFLFRPKFRTVKTTQFSQRLCRTRTFKVCEFSNITFHVCFAWS